MYKCDWIRFQSLGIIVIKTRRNIMKSSKKKTDSKQFQCWRWRRRNKKEKKFQTQKHKYSVEVRQNNEQYVISHHRPSLLSGEDGEWENTNGIYLNTYRWMGSNLNKKIDHCMEHGAVVREHIYIERSEKRNLNPNTIMMIIVSVNFFHFEKWRFDQRQWRWRALDPYNVIDFFLFYKCYLFDCIPLERGEGGERNVKFDWPLLLFLIIYSH